MTKPRKRLLTFNDPQPLRIDRWLAEEIGFLESIVLLQIEYHISCTDNERDGNLWTYQTLKYLQENDFPWLSIATISRVLKSLQDKDLLVVGNYNKVGYDQTRWYALNWDGVDKLQSVSIAPDGPILQNEKWSLQNEKSNFQSAKSKRQSAKSNLQNRVTVPNDSPKEESKDSPDSSGDSTSSSPGVTPWAQLSDAERSQWCERVKSHPTGILADTIARGGRIGRLVEAQAMKAYEESHK
jgi:hypothetical protein